MLTVDFNSYLQTVPDRLGWSLDISDIFSVSSTRSFLDNGLITSTDITTRWNNWVPIKLNILTWRVKLQSIPTRETLSSTGILVETIMCPICSCLVETVHHLFVGCSDLMDIWTRIAIWWGLNLPDPITIHSLLSWSDIVTLRASQRKIFDAVVITTFWCIWNFRNAIIFGTVIPKKALFFDDVVHKAFFWISNRCKKAKLGWSTWLHNPSFITM
ncbi:hypothetical protein Lser_V15G19875 [Lactuca serriola]